MVTETDYKVIVEFLTSGEVYSVKKDSKSNLTHLKRLYYDHFEEYVDKNHKYRVHLDDGTTKEMTGSALNQFVWGIRNIK